MYTRRRPPSPFSRLVSIFFFFFYEKYIKRRARACYDIRYYDDNSYCFVFCASVFITSFTVVITQRVCRRRVTANGRGRQSVVGIGSARANSHARFSSVVRHRTIAYTAHCRRVCVARTTLLRVAVVKYTQTLWTRYARAKPLLARTRYLPALQVLFSKGTLSSAIVVVFLFLKICSSFRTDRYALYASIFERSILLNTDFPSYESQSITIEPKNNSNSSDNNGVGR